MGIANPRPAMRSREERKVYSNLDRFAVLGKLMTDSGMHLLDASTIAFNIIITTKARKKIWRTK